MNEMKDEIEFCEVSFVFGVFGEAFSAISGTGTYQVQVQSSVFQSAEAEATLITTQTKSSPGMGPILP
jgi:hypothetical protein